MVRRYERGWPQKPLRLAIIALTIVAGRFGRMETGNDADWSGGGRGTV